MTVWNNNNITTNPDLSAWNKEGLALPLGLVSFREQVQGDKVALVIVWKPKKETKTEDHI